MSDPNKAAITILDAIGDKKVVGEASRIRQIDPLLGLRTNIISFFDRQMQEVAELADFRREVRGRMREMVLAGTVSYDQLERLHSRLGSDILQPSEAIMGLFHPTPGSPSPLAPIMQEKDPEDQKTGTLSSDKLQALDEVMRILLEASGRLSGSPPPAVPSTPTEPAGQGQQPGPTTEEDDYDGDDNLPEIPD